MKDFSLKAKIYVWAVILVGFVLFGRSVPQNDWHDWGLILILSLLASISLILTVEGTTSSSHYNISFFMYAFALVLLGLPATMLVILLSNLVEWLVRRYAWYIHAFNLGMYFITLACTSLIYGLINPSQTTYSAVNIIALMVAMVVFVFVNHLLVGIVVWLARGEDLVKSGLFDFMPLVIDFTLVCMGTAGALLWMLSPVAVVLAALPMYLIYSTLKLPALERKTETDLKTGLFNDQYFQHALEAELERANRFERPITVVMADMDLLRNINNTYGHMAGDQVLIGVARILKQSFRDVDTVARFGGEEFAILMPETTPEEIFTHIDDVRRKVQETDFTVDTSITPIRVTLSFGIAGRSEAHDSARSLINNADSALYHAKLNGRNRAYIYCTEGSHSSFQQPTRDNAAPTPTDSGTTRAPVDKHPGQAEHTPGEMPARPETPSSEPPHVFRPAWQLPTFIGLLATVCLVLFFALAEPLPDGYDRLGLLVLTCVLALTEWFSIDIYYRDTAVSTSTAPLLAGVFLFGPLGVLVMSLVFAIIAKIKHNSKWSRVAFNTCNQMLAGLICYGMIVLSGQGFAEWGIWAQMLLALVSAAMFYISTTAAISMAMHLDAGLPFKNTWKERFSWLLPYYLVMGLVAFIMAGAYLSQGLLAAGIVIIPLLMMRFSQKQYIDHTREAVSELRMKNTILERNTAEIKNLNEGLLNALAEVIDLRDPLVMGHSQQVSHYAVLLANRMGLPTQQVEDIRKASLLHDLGKLGLSEKILRKTGPLTIEEYTLVKGHPALGAEILAASQAFAPLVPVVRHHHERYDGKGYPDHLAGEAIPLEARIVAMADAVEAMALDRPYRRALSYDEIVLDIQRNTGTQFDPQVAGVMLDLLKEQGAQVLASTPDPTATRLALEQIRRLTPELGKRGPEPAAAD